MKKYILNLWDWFIECAITLDQKVNSQKYLGLEERLNKISETLKEESQPLQAEEEKEEQIVIEIMDDTEESANLLFSLGSVNHLIMDSSQRILELFYDKGHNYFKSLGEKSLDSWVNFLDKWIDQEDLVREECRKIVVDNINDVIGEANRRYMNAEVKDLI